MTLKVEKYMLFSCRDMYHKHWCISYTFLLKILVSNRGCGLSARTSGHYAVNLLKLSFFSENLQPV